MAVGSSGSIKPSVSIEPSVFMGPSDSFGHSGSIGSSGSKRSVGYMGTSSASEPRGRIKPSGLVTLILPVVPLYPMVLLIC